MSLDGVRAWIGEVERKLGVRTRVFLVMMAISIGGSGAAIYLALDADDGGSSGGATVEEVQELRDLVELGGGDPAQISALEAQIAELRAEIATGQSGSSGGGQSTNGLGLPESGAQATPESNAEK